MEISNFSSLIEVGVTLNIACVAIEYVKSYTKVLCNQVFNMEERIKNSSKACREKLNDVMDETTLHNLPETAPDGRSISTIKERRIRERNNLSTDITTKEEELKKSIGSVCEVKNISSICLLLFLFGISGLLLMGFESKEEIPDNLLIHIFWTTLTILCFIFAVIGWFINDHHRSWWIFDYRSLRFSLLSFGIVTICSCASMLAFDVECISSNVENCWIGTLVISLILLYSNFVASAIKVWRKAQKGIQNIEEEKNKLLARCEAWNNDASRLLGFIHVDRELSEIDGQEH